jgi:hypothetical protein
MQGILASEGKAKRESESECTLLVHYLVEVVVYFNLLVETTSSDLPRNNTILVFTIHNSTTCYSSVTTSHVLAVMFFLPWIYNALQIIIY